MKKYFVYIVSNYTRSVLYIGFTTDLVRRIDEHCSEKIEGFTKRYNAYYLVNYEVGFDLNRMRAREAQLKGWKRSKKDELILWKNPQLTDLYGDVLIKASNE